MRVSGCIRSDAWPNVRQPSTRRKVSRHLRARDVGRRGLGQPDAWHQHRHAAPVLGIRLAVDRAEVALLDLLQETRHRAPAVVDRVRRDRHAPSPARDADPDPVSPVGRTDRPEQVVVAREVARRLAEALARLPDSQRTAFELLKQDGLTLAEAAEVLGVTVTAVKLRAHRAYESIRAALGENMGDW